MKRVLLIIALLFHFSVLGSEYSLVFVHLGDSAPFWAITSIKQARFMNTSSDIFLLTNKAAIESIGASFDEQRITLVDVDQVPITDEHRDFRAQNGLSPSLNGFWKYTTERFYIIFDFLKHTQIQNAVHLENDTMLYVDLNEIVPTLQRLGIRLAAPFQSLYCVVPSFVFIKDIEALKPLIDHIGVETKTEHNCDMLTLASFFRKRGDEHMFRLPILMKEYAQHFGKRTSSFDLDNETSLDFLTTNDAAFPGYLFDAAALGVYANGNDKRYNAYTGPGQVHHRTLFDPGHFNYYWGEDAQGRPCPYLSFKDKSYRIVNLHLHSKELDGFASFANTRARFPEPARNWLVQDYLPQISGKMLFVGVGSYTQKYNELTKTPELFETVDVDKTKSEFGSPFGHHIADFLELAPNRNYDHCCMFGMLGHPPNTGTSVYTICNDDNIEKSLWHAHNMIKVGGTLMLGPHYKDVPGQDAAFWLQKFAKAPLDRYEVIVSTRGHDNLIWWGRKVKE